MTTSPAAAEDLFHEATRLLGQGHLDGAESLFLRALQLAPELAEAHANLGLLLDRTGRRREAEDCYRRALALAPQQFQTQINLGALLEEEKRFPEAEGAFRAALALNPESPMAWSNLGVLLACTGREGEAEQCCRTAIGLAPDYRTATFHLACLLLRQGRYAEGWACLEARDWYAQLEKQLPMPRWRGESLVGKSFLIGLEAGHGDMIQFCRYARLLKERGAVRVSVLCHPGLKSLLPGMAGVDEALAPGDPAPGMDWDYWSPPLSLPFHLQTRLATIPAELPYLWADAAKIEYWSSRLYSAADLLRVGLVWKGNPLFANDGERSLSSLKELAPLGQVAGVRYYSLQKGGGESELAGLADALPLVDPTASIADFSDTAAIIMNLDLVISVDTAVAHLAGALGKPCWLMLPDYKTDWRWLAERDDSPWYPGAMRLFRQDRSGDWAPVVSRIKQALAAYAGDSIAARRARR